MIDRILKYYKITGNKINTFLEETKNKHEDIDSIFFELMFCLSVPQTKAPNTRDCIKRLYDSGILQNGSEEDIYKGLYSVRFNEVKTKRILEARQNFDVIYDKIQELKNDPIELRKWIADNVNGLGWKEASHLLRNIGIGHDLAIFDIHVLRTMEKMGLIKSSNGKPITSATGKKYLEYEKIFQDLSSKHGLQSAQMDIAIWLMCSGNDQIM